MDGEDMAQILIRWNSHSKVLLEAMSKLLLTGKFADVTLACEGRTIKCHRTVLSTFSPQLAQILDELSAPDGVIYLGNGLKFNQLQTLLTFMYTGEAEITQDEMVDILKAAQDLKIRGLTVQDNSGNSGQDKNKTVHATTQVQEEESDSSDEDTPLTPVGNNEHLETMPSTSTVTQSLTQPSEMIDKGPSVVTQKYLQYKGIKQRTDYEDTESETEDSDNDNGLQESSRGDLLQQANTVQNLVVGSEPSTNLKPEGNGNDPNGLRTKELASKRKLHSAFAQADQDQPSSIGSGTNGSGTVNITDGGVAVGVKKARRRPKPKKVRQLPNKPSILGESMKQAVDIVRSGGHLTHTANSFGIPVTTLCKYVKEPDLMKRSKMYYFV